MKGFISKDDRNLNQWPTWLCVLLLFVCMTFSGYVPASMSAYMLGTAYFRAYGIEYSLWMVILTNGIVSIALFELFSRILFQLGIMFSRRTILMYPSEFLYPLRFYMMGINLVLGGLYLLIYACSVSIVYIALLANTVVSLAFLGVFLIRFVRKHFEKPMWATALLCLGAPYLAFSLLSLLGGLLI